MFEKYNEQEEREEIEMFISYVKSYFSDEKLTEIVGKQTNKKEGFEEGLYYFRDVLLNDL